MDIYIVTRTGTMRGAYQCASFSVPRARKICSAFVEAPPIKVSTRNTHAIYHRRADYTHSWWSDDEGTDSAPLVGRDVHVSLRCPCPGTCAQPEVPARLATVRP